MPIVRNPAPAVLVIASVWLRLRDWLGGTFLDYTGLKAGGDGQACVLSSKRGFDEMCWSTRFHWGISTGNCYELRRNSWLRSELPVSGFGFVVQFFRFRFRFQIPEPEKKFSHEKPFPGRT
jgi:hypothetical protein